MPDRHLLGLDIERQAAYWQKCRGNDSSILLRESKKLRDMLNDYVEALEGEGCMVKNSEVDGV